MSMELGRDQAGAKIYIGSRVSDDFFGEGDVTGKVACSGGGLSRPCSSTSSSSSLSESSAHST